MLILLRQGKIAKWFSGIGQEAISVGVGLAMEREEFILPMHRNLGVFTAREIPLGKLFCQFQGTYNGFTKGRDRSFHFGTKEYNIVGMISHLGPQMALADGIALGNLLKKNNHITAVFTGDGATSEGDFHEALNVAAVWDLPVIFIIENNGYGLSTPSSEQFRCKQFIDKAIGYGMEGIRVDGNNILEVYHAVSDLRRSMKKNPRPVLLECVTFRMRGHEEASGTKYVPKELMDEWAKKDPIENYEKFLKELGILKPAFKNEIREAIKTEIEEGLKIAFSDENPTPDSEREVRDMYAPSISIMESKGEKSDMRFLDAISDGMREAMRRHPELIIMGQDIAEYGGVFKATQGFLDEFGKSRIRNTPLCESAIVGAGLGLAINGFKSIVEMQFADFVTCGFNQIVNNLAKTYYRWGQHSDVVIRLPCGAGVGAGPFHSQSPEAWFFHIPGLKIAFPAFPEDAKALMIASVEDPNPVLFFEHKGLYRTISGPVSAGYYSIPFGKAAILSQGTHATIVTYGQGVHWALEALPDFEPGQIEIIDLRTLLPWDKETVVESVKKTNRVLVLHEDTLTGGVGGEIASVITEDCFEFLDAPVMRLASLDTAVPMSPILEADFLPAGRLKQSIRKLLEY